MIGKNPLWVAKQHGHSVQTMLETYAAWLDGTTESDLLAIKRAMEGKAAPPLFPADARELLAPRCDHEIDANQRQLGALRHEGNRER